MIHLFHGHSSKRRGRWERINNDGAASAISNVHYNESEMYNGDASENLFDFLENGSQPTLDNKLSYFASSKRSHAATQYCNVRFLDFNYIVWPDSNDHLQLVNNEKTIREKINYWMTTNSTYSCSAERAARRRCGCFSFPTLAIDSFSFMWFIVRMPDSKYEIALDTVALQCGCSQPTTHTRGAPESWSAFAYKNRIDTNEWQAC